MEYLSVPEYARLRGCSERYVRQLIGQNRLHAVENHGALGGGNGGVSYRIPAAALDPKLLKKYQRQQERKSGRPDPKPGKKTAAVNVEEMSARERQEIARWKNILEEWEAYRGQGGLKAERDEEFIPYISRKYPDMKFSVRILQRRRKDYLAYGEAALRDGRGKHENHKKAVPDEVFSIFMGFYLDESRRSVRKCMEMTESWLRHEKREDLLPLASSQTFSREVLRRVPPAALTLCREGMKKCTDTMMPYIRRTYEDLNSNDIWVCDNHTFDVFVNDGEHIKPVRVYLTAFQDVRSRKFVGWYVTLNPCSQATLTALRRAIEAYGIPKRILSDNGREFLTFDIGGRGVRRSRSTSSEEHEIPTILDNLGIEFRTAMVRNARAKIIERAFLDVKNEFSKMFEGYTGGTVMERPERLKKTWKDAENFTLLPEFIDYVDKYITGIFNRHKHSGVGMGGKSPDQVYAACLIEQRTATKEQLNLMMLRNTRIQKVGRDGVRLDLYGQKIYFNSHDLNFYHIGRKVYFRYDPDDLAEVRVYDDQDRFLCTAQQTGALGYFADREQVHEAVKENREYMKAVKTWKEQNVKKAHNELELMVWQAEQNLAQEEICPDPKIIRLVTADEEAERGLARAAGERCDAIDYTLAVERIRRAKEE